MIGDVNGQINIYNQNTSLAFVNSIQAHSNWTIRIKPSPLNTNYIATCSDDAKVKIWNVSSSLNWTLISTYCYISSYLNHLQCIIFTIKADVFNSFFSFLLFYFIFTLLFSINDLIQTTFVSFSSQTSFNKIAPSRI